MFVVLVVKSISLAFLAAWCIAQILACKYGWEERYKKRLSRGWEPDQHRRMAWYAFALLISTILCAEGSHWVIRGTVGGEHGRFFYFHLSVAVMLLAAMAAMLWKNGITSPRVHFWLAWIVMTCSPIVAVTGFILEWELK